jgi:hypothetical protein
MRIFGLEITAIDRAPATDKSRGRKTIFVSGVFEIYS